MTRRLSFDVFGRTLIVERDGDRWRAIAVGPDGKRSPAGVVIPGFVDEAELAQFLDDHFHEWATPEHPAVRKLAD
jgi:hypothetical protein